MLSNYIIHHSDQAFTSPEGRKSKQSVVVEKWKDGRKVNTKRYALVTFEELIAAIQKGEDINLNHCYVRDFQLGKLREALKMDEFSVVRFQNFKAEHAFFDSDTLNDFSYAHFEGAACSFSESIFNGGQLSFGHVHCDNHLNFRKAHFNTELVTFRFAEFNEGDVQFSGSSFDCEELRFVNTNFGAGNVSFREVDFGKSNINFQYARFDKGNVSFDKASFRGASLDFRKIEFGEGKAEFRRVDFGDGDLSFNESEFSDGKISFRSSRFGNGKISFEQVNFGDNEVSFEATTFGSGSLSFADSTFKSLLLQQSRIEGHTDLRIKKGERIDLSHAVIKDVIDFQTKESELDLKVLKIEGIKNLGRLFLSWKLNHVFDLIDRQTESSLASKALQYNLLKENFRANGQYTSEDSAYVAFKIARMKSDLEEAKAKGGIHQIGGYITYGFEWVVFYQAGLFATAPLRVLFSMIVVLIAFGFLFMGLHFFTHSEIVSSIGDPDHLNLFQRSMYHSAITFFTIGYGDFYPSGHIRWLSAVEGWCGVFLMSYFTVAFVRKVLR